MKSISAQEFLTKYNTGNLVVIDVRTTDEFSYAHLPNSIHIPADQLSSRLNEIPKNQDVAVICQSGIRSASACKALQELGLTRLTSVSGGIHAVQKSGGTIIKTTTTLPIMRQVQIIAGFLVVLGALLSLVVHPAWIGLSIFVGCGLMFAGLTGFCTMALLLAKMPWNRNTRGL